MNGDMKRLSRSELVEIIYKLRLDLDQAEKENQLLRTKLAEAETDIRTWKTDQSLKEMMEKLIEKVGAMEKQLASEKGGNSQNRGRGSEEFKERLKRFEPRPW